MLKPSDHGIVVESKTSGLRYASLDVNFDPETERKVRDLVAGETVLSYPVGKAESVNESADEFADESPQNLTIEDTINPGETGQ